MAIGIRALAPGLRGRFWNPFPSPMSQLHIPLAFQPWTGGAWWKPLFWGSVVGRTPGPPEAEAPASLRYAQYSAPSAAPSPLHSPPLTSCHHSLRVLLLLTGNLQQHLFFSLSAKRFSPLRLVTVQLLLSPSSSALAHCSLSWGWSLSRFHSASSASFSPSLPFS